MTIALLLLGCEAEPLGLPEGTAPPPSVAYELSVAGLVPGVRYVGDLYRVEADADPATGAPIPGTETCYWSYDAREIAWVAPPPGCPRCGGAVTVAYSTPFDLLGSSVCTPGIWGAAGVGVPFQHSISWDRRSSALWIDDGSGWAIVPAQAHQPQPGAFSWRRFVAHSP